MGQANPVTALARLADLNYVAAAARQRGVTARDPHVVSVLQVLDP